MAIQIKLRMLENTTEDEKIAGQLKAIGSDAEAAVEELRSLAHGIHPQALRDYGLADALRSFAMRTPMRISVVDNGIGRCSRTIEAAIYFCTTEAIQNVVKHAGHEARPTATLGRDGERVAFAISDDGPGSTARRPASAMASTACAIASTRSAASFGSSPCPASARRSARPSRSITV